MGDRGDWRTDPSVFRDLDDQWNGALTGRRSVVVTDKMATAAGTPGDGLPPDVLARSVAILAEADAADAEADAFEKDVVGVEPLPRARPTVDQLVEAYGDVAALRRARADIDARRHRAVVTRRRRFEARLAEVRASTGGPATDSTRQRLWLEESHRVGLSGGDLT